MRRGLGGRDVVRLCLVVLLLFVFACGETVVYHNLTEKDANEIVVALYNAGIEAVKKAEKLQNEVVWSVAVDKKYIQEARRILLEQNLPRKEEPGLCGIYKEKQIVPTPDEQKARFLCGVKGDIVNALKSIPEVADVSVVVNMPTPEEFAKDTEKRPTASVVVKVVPPPSGESVINESKIQQFVANAVEKLNPRDVSVVISYVSSPLQKKSVIGLGPTGTGVSTSNTPNSASGEMVKVMGINVSKESSARLKIYLAVFVFILIFLAGAMILNVIRTSKVRREIEALYSGSSGQLIGGPGEDRPRLEAGGEEKR